MAPNINQTWPSDDLHQGPQLADLEGSISIIASGIWEGSKTVSAPSCSSRRVASSSNQQAAEASVSGP